MLKIFETMTCIFELMEIKINNLRIKKISFVRIIPTNEGVKFEFKYTK